MDPKKYLERADVAVRSRLGLPNPWRTRSFLGRTVTVRAGTLAAPDVPDYDDAWLLACALHSKVVLDVGANVGQSAMLMLVGNPTIRELVLVEANWRALAIASENLIRNQLGARCRFVGAFAGEQDNQEMRLWTVGTGAAGSMYKGHAQTAASAGQMITIPTVTLDSVCDQFAVAPDFVKIDVEGAEHNVLLGARVLATKRQPRILVEMHSPPELPMSQNAALVLDWCKSVAYSAWYLDQEVLVDRPEQLAKRGRCHLLLQASGVDYPSWLRGIKQSSRLPTDVL